MAPVKGAVSQARRVLILNVEGIEVRHNEADEVIELMVDDTIPLPIDLFEQFEEWAKEAGFSRHEAAIFREEIGEKAVRLIDERFLLNRLRSY